MDAREGDSAAPRSAVLLLLHANGASGLLGAAVTGLAATGLARKRRSGRDEQLRWAEEWAAGITAGILGTSEMAPAGFQLLSSSERALRRTLLAPSPRARCMATMRKRPEEFVLERIQMKPTLKVEPFGWARLNNVHSSGT